MNTYSDSLTVKFIREYLRERKDRERYKERRLAQGYEKVETGGKRQMFKRKLHKHYEQ